MEMQARRGRVEEVLDRAEAVAALRTPEVELVREGAGHVRQLWEVLQVEMERRTVMLDAVSHAQQYYTQAAKAESWLSGQKLQVLNEENGNVCTVPKTQSIYHLNQGFSKWGPGTPRGPQGSARESVDIKKKK